MQFTYPDFGMWDRREKMINKSVVGGGTDKSTIVKRWVAIA